MFFISFRLGLFALRSRISYFTLASLSNVIATASPLRPLSFAVGSPSVPFLPLDCLICSVPVYSIFPIAWPWRGVQSETALSPIPISVRVPAAPSLTLVTIPLCAFSFFPERRPQTYSSAHSRLRREVFGLSTYFVLPYF